MDKDAYDARLRTRSPLYRRILDEAEKGDISTSGLREKFGRADGMTKPMVWLLENGFLREVGPRRIGPHSTPMHYRLVPLQDVDLAAARYAERMEKAKGRKAAKRKGPSPSQRLRDLPTRTEGEKDVWIRTRKNILHLTSLLTRMLPSRVLWNCIPDKDLEAIALELAELEDAIEKAVDALYMRADDDAHLAKLKKILVGTEDGDDRNRTPAEIKTAKTLAERYTRRREVLDQDAPDS